jgi:hypothetical protein
MASEQPIHFTLLIEGGPDSDEREIDRLTRSLLSEIDETNVEDAKIPPSAGPPPEGSKPGEAITIGQIAVDVLPVVIPALIGLLQGWLLRQQNQSIKVKIGEIEVEIPRGLPQAELERIVDQVQQIGPQK